MTNPYQSPQRGADSAGENASGLFVECECGRRISVTSAAAGTQVACPCGRPVAVPRLSELRRQSGQSAYITNAVEATRALLCDGYVPGDGLCSGCGVPTSDQAQFDVSCEQTFSDEQSRGARIVMLLLAGLVSGLLFWRLLLKNDDATPVVHGRDTSIRLPVWLCDRCQTEPRYRQPRGAKALLLRIGEYSEIFREYPSAGVQRAGSRR